MSEPIKPTVLPEDWPEDFAHENGCYMNRCCVCSREFCGHKRRATCKACTVTEPIKPHDAGACEQTMTPAVQAVIDAADKRERDKAAMPADCTTPTGCRENGCHGACLPAVTKPIKLPPMPLEDALKRAYYYTEAGEWRYSETCIEWDRWHSVAKVATLAVEQNTADLREALRVTQVEACKSIERLQAERDEARAEVERLRALLTRYRNETPLGHQPHMIAHEVDAVLKETK